MLAWRMYLLTLITTLVLLPGVARADFTAIATLLGANERPNPTNSLGFGEATIQYHAALDDITYDVTYNNLTSPAVVGHIHVGPITGTGRRRRLGRGARYVVRGGDRGCVVGRCAGIWFLTK